MQNSILILGLGAFGFAIAKHLGENNPALTVYASEIHPEIFGHIEKTREHPYFFPGVVLPQNIILIQDTSILISEIDIIVSAIPCQFFITSFEKMQHSLKYGVTILNLSKGINNQTLKVSSEALAEILEEQSYHYAYLAGGMIAEELVSGKPLGADIVTQNSEIGEILRMIFASPNLDIHLIIGNIKNTELYAALKNIIALIIGFYEGQGYGASSLGRILVKLLKEIELLVKILGGEQGLRFTDYALGGDIIATCFGNSRNRLLGTMLGSGIPLQQALEDLKKQKKIAEGYETLIGISKIIKEEEGFELIGDFAKKYI